MPDKIEWKTLKHAHGPATRVPVQIEALKSAAVEEDRNEAYWTLHNTLVQPSAWFEASAPAVALLLETGAAAPDPTLLFILAADILGGDQLRAWVDERRAPETPAEKAAREAAINQKGALFGALASEQGGARGAAAMALAMLPEIAHESVPLLARQAETDAHEIARAGALLALGKLGVSDAEVAAVIASALDAGQPPFVRGAAGVSWLRLDAGRTFGQARAAIEAWLSYTGSAELPWFKVREWVRGLGLTNATGRPLVALARHRGDAAVADLTEVALALATESKSGPVETQTAKILLDLGEFLSKPLVRRGMVLAVARVEDLSPEQLEMARRLAPTHVLPMGRFGMPASGATRRRWIGLDPPGPLERVVTTSDGGRAPQWRAWSESYPEPDDFPSPVDRWQALIEYAALSYPHADATLDSDEIEATLRATPATEELLDRATRIADDLAERFEAIARIRPGSPLEFTASSLLLLPLVRAGRAIEPRWDRLVYVGEEPLAREILSAIPAPRREAILCDYLDAEISSDAVDHALGAVDLAPTPRVLESFQRQFDAWKDDVTFKSRLREMRAQLAKATGKPPKATTKPAKKKSAPTKPAKPAKKSALPKSAKKKSALSKPAKKTSSNPKAKRR